MSNLKATIDVEIKPFNVPNFAVIVDSSADDPRNLPLSALPLNTLMSLCYEFEKAVYDKAGKHPTEQAIICPRCNEPV